MQQITCQTLPNHKVDYQSLKTHLSDRLATIALLVLMAIRATFGPWTCWESELFPQVRVVESDGLQSVQEIHCCHTHEAMEQMTQ